MNPESFTIVLHFFFFLLFRLLQLIRYSSELSLVLRVNGYWLIKTSFEKSLHFDDNLVWLVLGFLLITLGSVTKNLLVMWINKNGNNDYSPLCLASYTVDERTIARGSPEQSHERCSSWEHWWQKVLTITAGHKCNVIWSFKLYGHRKLYQI